MFTLGLLAQKEQWCGRNIRCAKSHCSGTAARNTNTDLFVSIDIILREQVAAFRRQVYVDKVLREKA